MRGSRGHYVEFSSGTCAENSSSRTLFDCLHHHPSAVFSGRNLRFPNFGPDGRTELDSSISRIAPLDARSAGSSARSICWGEGLAPGEFGLRFYQWGPLYVAGHRPRIVE